MLQRTSALLNEWEAIGLHGTVVAGLLSVEMVGIGHGIGSLT